jgi:uracil-DNA glycosylase
MDNLFADVKPGWKLLLESIWGRWGTIIEAALDAERAAGNEVFPQPADIMRCFTFFDLDDLKVVLLGQDPYIKKGEAHGLAFSVPDGIKVPPSLRNVYKCLSATYGKSVPTSGKLEGWAQQGVLLLNTALTVRAGASGSHMKIWAGWTEELITAISAVKAGVVYMMWGEKAKSYIDCIASPEENCLLCYSHPSPLARKDFSTCPNFRDADAYLSLTGRSVVWI